MFGRLATVNVSPMAMKDTFNDEIMNNLFISFEEGETGSFTDKTVNTFIKR
jgi:hypothetical protein